MSKDVSSFLSCLSAAEHVPRPENEEWKELINRINVPGRIAMIDEKTYFYFLEVLPPKFMTGGLFAFAEGAEEIQLFWRSNGQFFCRKLTWNETRDFCLHAHVSFPYWF